MVYMLSNNGFQIIEKIKQRVLKHLVIIVIINYFLLLTMQKENTTGSQSHKKSNFL